MDIAVSAPRSGGALLRYYGIIFVFFGDKTPSRSFSSYLVISSAFDREYVNLGNSLSVGDLTQDGHPDLVVGSPMAPSNSSAWQSGTVTVYASTVNNIAGENLGWIMNSTSYFQGRSRFTWTGASTVVTSNGELLIGNAAATYGSNSAVGSVDQSSPNAFTENYVTCSERHMYCGSSLGEGYLWGCPGGVCTSAMVVGAPSADTSYQQGGKVLVYNRTCLALDDSNCLAFFIEGAHPFSQLGASVLAQDIDSDGAADLAVGAPSQGGGGIHSQPIAGAAYFWRGGKSMPQGGLPIVNPSQMCDRCIRGRTRGYYGSSQVFLDFDGDGNMDWAVGGRQEGCSAPAAGAVAVDLNLIRPP